MKKLILAAAAALFCAGAYAINDPVQYVNPLVGSHSTGGLSTGNTYPAIKCKFKLLKNGKLHGTYYLRLDEGQELNGEMTLQKESTLGQYAE